MENSKLPAFSVPLINQTESNQLQSEQMNGLTKHEYACIKLGIPETGDTVIDDIIRKSERKRLASMAMHGLISTGQPIDHEWCVRQTDEIIKQLEK